MRSQENLVGSLSRPCPCLCFNDRLEEDKARVAVETLFQRPVSLQTPSLPASVNLISVCRCVTSRSPEVPMLRLGNCFTHCGHCYSLAFLFASHLRERPTAEAAFHPPGSILVGGLPLPKHKHSIRHSLSFDI